jgi:surface antigen
MSQHLEGLFGSSKDDARAFAKADDKSDAGSEATGSIPARAAAASSGLPPEGDLAIAKATVSDVMARGGKDTSAAWENPRTGARGTVTPIATAYTHEGITCRDFLASHVRAGAESWMQGEACRAPQGRWEVKSLRPWKRS